jgi:parallel beta-helix repeat protein
MRGCLKKIILILLLTVQALTIFAADNCQLGVSNKTCTCTKSGGSLTCGYQVETFCNGTDYYNTTLTTPSRWANTDICDPTMPVTLESSGLNLQPGVAYSINLAGFDVLGRILCSYNDTLVCAGANTTTYNCTTCDDCNTKIDEATSGDTINLAEDITGADSDCISIYDKYNITFDCRGRLIAGADDSSWYYYGMEITDSSWIAIKNCRMSSFDTGIYLGECDSCTLKNNTLSNGRTGIYVYGSETENDILNGNTANNNTEGIHVYSTQNCTIENNSANGNSETGIYLEYLDNATVYNNKAEGNAWRGIYADSLYNSGIKGNIADNNEEYGLHISYSENGTVSHNTADNNTERGISIVNCINETADNNAAEYNSEGIVLVYTYNSTFIQNDADHNTNYGFYIELSDNNSFTNNSASGNAGSGFYLELSDNNTIRGNNANWNNDGIHLYYSDYNSFRQNTADNNTGIGIYMGSSNKNSLSDNSAAHNSEGLHMDTSEENAIYANAFCGNDIFDVDQPAYIDNTGRNNTCDRTSNWNETGTDGCTYSCEISDTTTTTIPGECGMPGDAPPCGVISLEEVVNSINEWATGGRTLPEVIGLINAWAASG